MATKMMRGKEAKFQMWIDDSFSFSLPFYKFQFQGLCSFGLGFNTRLTWSLIYDIPLVRSIYAPRFGGEMGNEDLVDTW